MHHQPRDFILLAGLIVCVCFWLLAAMGTVLLLREVNAQLRPRRLALLGALLVTDVTPRGRILQRCTTIGIVGFLAGIFFLGVLNSVLR